MVTLGCVYNNDSATTNSYALPQNESVLISSPGNIDDVSDTDSYSIPFVSGTGISVVKSSLTSSIGAPQDVLYNYLVTNTGDETLNDINLVDDNLEDEPICTDILPSNTLAPGDFTTCTATKTTRLGHRGRRGPTRTQRRYGHSDPCQGMKTPRG